MVFSLASLNLENLAFPRTDFDQVIYPMKIKSLALQIKRLDADIVVLQELIDLACLDEILPPDLYPARRFTNNTEGIRCAVIAKEGIELTGTINHTEQFTEHWIYDEDKTINIQCSWDRPLLEVQALLPDGTDLIIFAIHLKSKRATNLKGLKKRIPKINKDRKVWASLSDQARGSFASTIRRVAQAVQLRTIIDNRLHANSDANIIVAGDFNGDEGSVTYETICGNAVAAENWGLKDKELIPCDLAVPKSKRFTYIFQGRKQMLDHILINKNLLARFQRMQIFNETLRDEHIPYRNEEYFPESDHAPLIAYFK